MKLPGNDMVRFLLSLALVLVGAFLASFWFTKVDLTKEKRHTLTEATITMLGKLEEPVFIRCYLHGEFPAGFKRLERSVRERLDEFVDYSHGKVEYEFIDPYDSDDSKTIQETQQALTEKGLEFTVLSTRDAGGQSDKIIWPGAIISFQGKEMPVQFFNSISPTPTDEMINNSVNNLEFQLTSVLRRAMRREKPAVAVIQGHGELQDIQMASFLDALVENYDVELVPLNEQISSLSDKLDGVATRTNKYAAAIIAKPDSAISDRDRFILDQFIMNGGKVLWMVDPVLTDLDSLRTQQFTMAVSNENELYSQLFEYGCRLNRNLIVDLNSQVLRLDRGPMGNQRNMVDVPFFFCPLISAPDTAHPIVANLNPILMRFVSSIDFVNPNPEVEKKVLLTSSARSKNFRTPVRVGLGIAELGVDYFNDNNTPYQPVVVLMTGKFPSAFTDRITKEIRTDPSIAFREKSLPTSMIVISDGDVARNEVMPTKDGFQPVPLGYEPHPNARAVVYDNLEFLLNCMNYLLDDEALISVRSRTIQLRKLDEKRVLEGHGKWQFINVVLPLIFVALLGFFQGYVRKKKWGLGLKNYK